VRLCGIHHAAAIGIEGSNQGGHWVFFTSCIQPMFLLSEQQKSCMTLRKTFPFEWRKQQRELHVVDDGEKTWSTCRGDEPQWCEHQLKSGDPSGDIGIVIRST